MDSNISGAAYAGILINDPGGARSSFPCHPIYCSDLLLTDSHENLNGDTSQNRTGKHPEMHSFTKVPASLTSSAFSSLMSWQANPCNGNVSAELLSRIATRKLLVH